MKHRAKEKASAALCAYYIMQASAGQRGTEQQRALAPSPAHTIQYAICFAHAYDTHTHTHHATPGPGQSDDYATLLDPFLAALRRRRITPYIPKGSSLLDIGCGKGKLLFDIAHLLEKGVGIDQRIINSVSAGNIRLIGGRVETTLPFADASFDTVSLLAVLEHLEHPETVLQEILRVLRPGGAVLLTVPTVHAKPVLEFLGFRLGVISREGVADHKRYYTKATLAADLRGAGFIIERTYYFELGFNLFAAAKKPVTQTAEIRP